MTLIQHIELGSAQANITFSSIPQTYTDLYLVVSSRHEGNDYGLSIQFNGSTANITYRNLLGNGSAVGSDTNYFTQVGLSDRTAYTANTFSNNGIYICNYASSSPKSYSGDGVLENNATQGGLVITAGLFNSTNPITSVSVNGQTTTGSNSLVQYTSATLYGILKGTSNGVTVS
jgi:hypothetical protein